AKLIEGVNEVFGQRDDAFVIDGIDFTAIGAGNETDQAPLALDGERDQPLRLWVVPKENSEDMPGAVAKEIARLLAGGVTIGGREIVPLVIAVLVSTIAQPAQIRSA